MYKFAKKPVKQKSPTWDSLSPEAKRAITAGISALAGGAIGSYAAGKDHRILGALTGAGLAGGLALSSNVLRKGVSSAAGTVLPPPKSKSEGMMSTSLPISAGLFAAPVALHLSRPGESRMRDILQNLIKNNSGAGPSAYRAVHAQNILNTMDSELGKIDASAGHYLGKLLGRRAVVSRAAHDTAVHGLFTGVTDPVIRPNLYRRLMSNNWIRRPAAGASLLAALVLAGKNFKKRYDDNRDKIERGWG